MKGPSAGSAVEALLFKNKEDDQADPAWARSTTSPPTQFGDMAYEFVQRQVKGDVKN
ncbi:hypothetical protein [Streptomyces sp. NPDC002676]